MTAPVPIKARADATIAFSDAPVFGKVLPVEARATAFPCPASALAFAAFPADVAAADVALAPFPAVAEPDPEADAPFPAAAAALEDDAVPDEAPLPEPAPAAAPFPALAAAAALEDAEETEDW